MTPTDEIDFLKGRVRDLEALLRQTDRSIENVFRLPPALCKLMGLLIALPHVTEAMITERLEIATVGKVAVWRLRQALEAHNIIIHSKRTVGWWLDDDTKERVKQMLDSAVTLKVTAAA
jgi:hypothetical protein